jgi:Ras-related protein Rab-2A
LDRNAALMKLILIGDTGVGKSCILAKLIKEEFKEEHNVTIGVEFGNYSMIVNNDQMMKLQIWDTAGQESFRSITRIFYKGSQAVMLVFDITERQTFMSIRSWQKEI